MTLPLTATPGPRLTDIHVGVRRGHGRLAALVHLADGVHELGERRVLQHVGGGAGRQGPKDVFVAMEHRQHDDPGLSIDAADGRDRVDARHPAELKVHQCHVGPELDVALDRFFA